MLFLYDGYSHGDVHDVVATTFSAGVFTLLLWALVIVPAILLDRQLRWLDSLWKAVGLATGGAIALLWIMVGWWLIAEPIYPWLIQLTVSAGMAGGITGGGAYAGARRAWLRSAAGPPVRAVVLLWLTGPTLVALWLTIAWPVVCHVSPELAYHVGSSQTRAWALRYVLRDVEPGDPAAKLTKRLPAAFERANDGYLMVDHTWMFGSSDRELGIRIENGRITEIRR